MASPSLSFPSAMWCDTRWYSASSRLTKSIGARPRWTDQRRMSIVIANRQRTKRIDSRRLKQIVNVLLEELNITDAELGIHLVGAPEMARVNWQFLQHEGSTDVITF